MAKDVIDPPHFQFLGRKDLTRKIIQNTYHQINKKNIPSDVFAGETEKKIHGLKNRKLIMFGWMYIVLLFGNYITKYLKVLKFLY